MASNQLRRHRRSFGAIRQLASGKWQARFKDLKGAEHARTFTTKTAADNYLASKQSERNAEIESQNSGRWLLDINRGAITLGEYASRHMAAKSDWSARTRELNERLAARFIFASVEDHYLADKSLHAISPLMVREWFAAVQRATFESATEQQQPRALSDTKAAKLWAKSNGQVVEPLGVASVELKKQWRAAGSPQPGRIVAASEISAAGSTTAAQSYQLLKAIFNQAIKDLLLDRNPAQDQPMGKLRTRGSQIATIEQLDQLAAQVPPRYAAAVLVAAYSGARQGELFALARRHFDPKTNTLTIERAVQKIKGKPAYIGATKTKASNRPIPLPQSIGRLLWQHMEQFTGGSSEDLIFTTGGGKIVTSSELCSWWIPARERVGLTKLKWHELRHTGSSLAAATGASLPALMARLGHSSARASLLYQHAAASDGQRIADNLEQGLVGAKLYQLADIRKASNQ